MQVLSSSPSPRLQGSAATSSLHYRRPSNGSPSQSRSPTVLSRRPIKSPVIRRPHYTYKDAATQYSPMSPVGRNNPSIAHDTLQKTSEPSAGQPVIDPSSAGENAASAPRDPSTSDTHTRDEEKAQEASLTEPPEPALQVGMPSAKRGTLESRDSESQVSTAGASLKRVRSGKKEYKVLPEKYELCAIEDLVVLIANMLAELIETNDPLPLRNGVLTRFHSRAPPGISVLDYLNRLAKHATLTPPLLLSMVYYIDKLCSMYPAFTINTLTVHRFLITSATVAAKGLSDSFWNNSTYARVGGLKVAELGLLELEFLYRVDWRIVPNPEVLVDYYQGLVERSDNYILDTDTDLERAGSHSSDELMSSPEETT